MTPQDHAPAAHAAAGGTCPAEVARGREAAWSVQPGVGDPRRPAPLGDLVADELAELRAALVADPKGTLESTFGVSLPDGMIITVIEETPTQRYIVLPSASLSEAELADVSGAGTGPDRAAGLPGCLISAPSQPNA